MAIYDLYRGKVFLRQEVLSGPQLPTIRISHIQKFKEYRKEFNPSDLAHDCIETFVIDEHAGCYVSHDYPNLPAWLHRQEFEAQEEWDRQRRLDRSQAMMGSGR